MKNTAETKPVRTNIFGGMKTVIELQLKIVESAVSLKMSEIYIKAIVENKLQDVNPVCLWTLPDGTATGDSAMVDDYFCRLVMGKLGDCIEGNYMKALKDIIAEIDKLTVEIVGELPSMEA